MCDYLNKQIYCINTTSNYLMFLNNVTGWKYLRNEKTMLHTPKKQQQQCDVNFNSDEWLVQILCSSICWEYTGYTSAQMTITVGQQSVRCIKKDCSLMIIFLVIFNLLHSWVTSSVSLAGLFPVELTLFSWNDCFRGIYGSYTFTMFGYGGNRSLVKISLIYDHLFQAGISCTRAVTFTWTQWAEH